MLFVTKSNLPKTGREENAAYQKTISTEQMATASCKMVFGNFIYYL